jgi:hypothetical protein
LGVKHNFVSYEMIYFFILYPKNQSVLGPKVGILWDFWGVWEQPKNQNS